MQTPKIITPLTEEDSGSAASASTPRSPGDTPRLAAPPEAPLTPRDAPEPSDAVEPGEPPEAALWLASCAVIRRDPRSHQLRGVDLDVLFDPGRGGAEGVIVIHDDYFGIALELTPESATRLGRELQRATAGLEAEPPPEALNAS